MICEAVGCGGLLGDEQRHSWRIGPATTLKVPLWEVVCTPIADARVVSAVFPENWRSARNYESFVNLSILELRNSERCAWGVLF